MYKIRYDKHNTVIILETEEQVISFVEEPNNKYYQDYLIWLDEGNAPEIVEPIISTIE